MSQADDYLTPLEAGKLLGVCQQTIYRWITRGKLKALSRAGTRYLVKRGDVEALMSPVRPKKLKVETARGQTARAKRTEQILARAGLS